jgi:hypothetical protein
MMKKGERPQKRGPAMAYDIRPLTFTEVLDRSFAVLRDRFWLFVGITVVAWIPEGVLLALSGPRSVLFPLLGMLALLILAPLAHAALTVAVAEVYLGSITTDIGEAYRAVSPILASIIGTYLLIYIFFIPLVVLLVLPMIYFMICWALVAPVMIVENTFGMAALSRSRALIRGAWWRTFGLMFVIGIISSVPVGALEFLWAAIPVLGPILNAVTEAVVSSFCLVVIVIYYFDRRCRTEEFDLRLLAQQIRAEGGGAISGTSVA